MLFFLKIIYICTIKFYKLITNKLNYNILHELLDWFQQYEIQLEGKPANLESFRIWFNRQAVAQATSNPLQQVEGEDASVPPIFDVETEISKTLVQLSRYAKLWIRKSLEQENELVNEDFTYIFALMRNGSMTKTQLIQENIHEKASGLEIIKRLLKYQFIEEKADELDKRSKQVSLTEKGRQMFFKLIHELRPTSQLIAGNLTMTEKNQLFQLLKKLDHFHQPLFMEEKHKSIAELLKNIDFEMN